MRYLICDLSGYRSKSERIDSVFSTREVATKRTPKETGPMDKGDNMTVTLETLRQTLHPSLSSSNPAVSTYSVIKGKATPPDRRPHV